jgi:23S rRNA (guanosine2251-2'-O)-methyltransferase
MAPGPVGGTAGEASEQGDYHAAAAPSDLIWGRHAAQAALESGRPIHRVWCTPEMRFSPRFLQQLREAKAGGVLVEEVTWARLGQISGGAVHQGIVLQPAAAETLDLPSLIDGCRSLGEPPLLIAVDGLTDPQNLGAIVRSAEALGAHGMVLPQRRNAGLTGSVAKVAAGALEHLPVARVVNLNRSLDALRQEGYRVIGLAAEGTVTLEEADLEGPLVVVTGSEGDGLSLLTRRSCDQLVRIPLRGATPSLNASVATALLLFEIARRGWMQGLRGHAPAPRIQCPALATEPAEAAAEVDMSEVDKAEASEQADPTPETDLTPEIALSPDGTRSADSTLEQQAELEQATVAVPAVPEAGEPSPWEAATLGEGDGAAAVGFTSGIAPEADAAPQSLQALPAGPARGSEAPPAAVAAPVRSIRADADADTGDSGWDGRPFQSDIRL